VTSAITLLNPHSLSLSASSASPHASLLQVLLSLYHSHALVCSLSLCHFVVLFFLLVNDKDSFFHFIFSATKHFFFLNKPFLTRWAWWLRWGLYLLIPTFFFNILAYWVMWFLFWAGFCSFIFSHKAFSFSGNSDVGWFFYEVFPLLVCINEIFIGHESSLKPILFLWVSWFL
jgi:hypothetical protein